MKFISKLWISAALLLCGFLVVIPVTASAIAPVEVDRDFSIQVTPSPLVHTVQPGVKTELELQIRNAGSQSEDLKIEPRSFSVTENTEEVKLDDDTPPEVAQWISFSSPNFTVASGQTFVQKVRINIPKDAGFSYAFALVIGRQKNPTPKTGSRAIRGSVAVFTLLNVDRPDATRKLSLTKLSISKRVYEYLPSEISIQFKNNGNTIIQPYGNIFIQRGETDDSPLASLPVNDKKGYILPNATRTVHATWSDGFPVYQTNAAQDGTTTTSLKWDWSNADHFRIGKYTAKIVAVYNDGTRDVPIESTVSFWVIPWKILLGLLIVVVIIVLSFGSFFLRIFRYSKRKLSRKPKSGE